MGKWPGDVYTIFKMCSDELAASNVTVKKKNNNNIKARFLYSLFGLSLRHMIINIGYRLRYR